MVLMNFVGVGTRSFPSGFGWVLHLDVNNFRGRLLDRPLFSLVTGQKYSTISLSDSCYIFLMDSPLPRLRHSFGSSLGYRIDFCLRVASDFPNIPIDITMTASFRFLDSNGTPLLVVRFSCFAIHGILKSQAGNGVTLGEAHCHYEHPAEVLFPEQTPYGLHPQFSTNFLVRSKCIFPYFPSPNFPRLHTPHDFFMARHSMKEMLNAAIDEMII